jgi:hypothetical protein
MPMRLNWMPKVSREKKFLRNFREWVGNNHLLSEKAAVRLKETFSLTAEVPTFGRGSSLKLISDYYKKSSVLLGT